MSNQDQQGTEQKQKESYKSGYQEGWKEALKRVRDFLNNQQKEETNE